MSRACCEREGMERGVERERERESNVANGCTYCVSNDKVIT